MESVVTKGECETCSSDGPRAQRRGHPIFVQNNAHEDKAIEKQMDDIDEAVIVQARRVNILIITEAITESFPQACLTVYNTYQQYHWNFLPALWVQAGAKDSLFGLWGWGPSTTLVQLISSCLSIYFNLHSVGDYWFASFTDPKKNVTVTHVLDVPFWPANIQHQRLYAMAEHYWRSCLHHCCDPPPSNRTYEQVTDSAGDRRHAAAHLHLRATRSCAHLQKALEAEDTASRSLHHAEGIAKRQAGSSVFVQPKRRGGGHDRQLMRNMPAPCAASVAPGSPRDRSLDTQASRRGYARPPLTASRVQRTRLASTLLTAVS